MTFNGKNLQKQQILGLNKWNNHDPINIQTQLDISTDCDVKLNKESKKQRVFVTPINVQCLQNMTRFQPLSDKAPNGPVLIQKSELKIQFGLVQIKVFFGLKFSVRSIP